MVIGEITEISLSDLTVLSYIVCILHGRDWTNAFAELFQVPWDILLCQDLGQARQVLEFLIQAP